MKKANSGQWPAASASGAVAEKVTVRRLVISASPIVASGGRGRAVGSDIAMGAPATTSRASGPVGDGWPWS